MNYQASIRDFFRAPRWKNNLLLGALAIIIPVVGPIILSGWHITVLWARGPRDEPETFPPFDFQFFGKYLERGLWPFLVSMVTSLVMVPIMMIVIMPLMFTLIATDGRPGHPPEALVIVAVVGIFALQMALMTAFQIVSTPLLVRATITQGFQSAFDLHFLKRFLALTWKELVCSMVFMLGVGLCMMVLAVVTCYIGAILAAPVAVFSWHHLQKQLYQLYLLRGGESIPLSPKLCDLPPPLPATI